MDCKPEPLVRSADRKLNSQACLVMEVMSRCEVLALGYDDLDYIKICTPNTTLLSIDG
jgi:hypothetical protein